jgi:misacylated tRNA(Ala) deacylase
VHLGVGSRVYLDDSYLREFDAEVVEHAEGWCTLSRTCFHPGGGGQPHDRGTLTVRGETCAVTGVREDEKGQIWHFVACDVAAGEAVRGAIDWPFRYALMRHHALMHVVNTVALRELGALMTGTQLGADRSHIDFKLSGFTRERIPSFEAAVNEVIVRDLAVTSSVISEDEYRRRPELVRTRNVSPPVVDGAVRIVGIAGFDAQACGGTHVHSTHEIGRARIAKGARAALSGARSRREQPNQHPLHEGPLRSQSEPQCNRPAAAV